MTDPMRLSWTDPVAVPAAHRLRPRVLVAAFGFLAVVSTIAVTVGAAGIPLSALWASTLDALPGIDASDVGGGVGLSDRQRDIVLSIRLPRLVLGLLVGAALGMSGAAFQGVFRNPLADPYLLGVSAGAGLGAILVLGLGLDVGWGPAGSVPIAAFVGALVAVAGSVLISRGSWRSPATLLLAGVAIASLFAAAQTFILQRLNATRAREVLSWLFGQLSANGWSEVVLLAPYMAVCGVVLILHRRHLDILRVGDEEARSLGLNPTRTRMVVVVTASLLTAAAVAVSGLIAFVGLVVPHLVRILVSHSYRVIVPITAFVGAPFFAFVLWRAGEEGL